ncbi:MAG: hypothetical protein ACUVTU_02510 [Desulfurispora sp.]|uniref:hypothetical protein n=1 Tax=Desulfurispora sp. TaxID=3014275 RepID=UPI00404A3D9C
MPARHEDTAPASTAGALVYGYTARLEYWLQQMEASSMASSVQKRARGEAPANGTRRSGGNEAGGPDMDVRPSPS